MAEAAKASQVAVEGQLAALAGTVAAIAAHLNLPVPPPKGGEALPGSESVQP